LVKTQRFGQKLNFRSKIKILIENPNFWLKIKLSPTLPLLTKNLNFDVSKLQMYNCRIFDKIFDFWPKIRLLTKIINVNSCVGYPSEIHLKLGSSSICCICFDQSQDVKIWYEKDGNPCHVICFDCFKTYATEAIRERRQSSKQIFGQKFDVWPNLLCFEHAFRFLTKSLICDQNLNFWPKFKFLTKISIFDQKVWFLNTFAVFWKKI